MNLGKKTAGKPKPDSPADALIDLVAQEVRAWLARRMLPTRKVAARLGWTPQYLSMRLAGSAEFRVGELAALAEVLDVPAFVFFLDPEEAFAARDDRERPAGEQHNSGAKVVLPDPVTP
jgi:transcriptional regulator with XRE-family HTH domain